MINLTGIDVDWKKLRNIFLTFCEAHGQSKSWSTECDDTEREDTYEIDFAHLLRLIQRKGMPREVLIFKKDIVPLVEVVSMKVRPCEVYLRGRLANSNTDDHRLCSILKSLLRVSC